MRNQLIFLAMVFSLASCDGVVPAASNGATNNQQSQFQEQKDYDGLVIVKGTAAYKVENGTFRFLKTETFKAQIETPTGRKVCDYTIEANQKVNFNADEKGIVFKSSEQQREIEFERDPSTDVNMDNLLLGTFNYYANNNGQRVRDTMFVIKPNEINITYFCYPDAH